MLIAMDYDGEPFTMDSYAAPEKHEAVKTFVARKNRILRQGCCQRPRSGLFVAARRADRADRGSLIKNGFCYRIYAAADHGRVVF